MTIQDFIIEAKKDTLSFLNYIYDDVIELTDQEIIKANDTKLHGFVIRRKNSPAGANIYVDDLFERHESGENMSELIEELKARCLYALECPVPPVDSLADLDLDIIRSRLTLKLLDVRRNKGYLSDRPYIDAGCGLAMAADLGCDDTILAEWKTAVTNDLLDSIGCSREELLTAAMENTVAIEPPLLMDLPDYVRTGNEKNFLDPSSLCAGSYTGPFILTNKSQYRGATALFYPGIQQKISEIFRSGYYILPISIHEVLIIPDAYSPDTRHLQDMLINGNRTVVDGVDVLSDKVLHYDPDRDGLTLVSTDEESYQHSHCA